MKLIREEERISSVWEVDWTDKMCDLHLSSKAVGGQEETFCVKEVEMKGSDRTLNVISVELHYNATYNVRKQNHII